MLFFIPLSLGVFFLMSALKSNIVYFISPSELINSNNINQKLRLGGLVEEDSIIINGKLVKFRITDGNKSVLVQYNGILPDLFKEKQGVIVEGEFDSLIFNANNLLAKHDENYIPKEVANSLKQQGLWKGKTEIE
jgi:cytochrome c-type biogenesis protein CcmE